jgi:hypothetical protein
MYWLSRVFILNEITFVSNLKFALIGDKIELDFLQVLIILINSFCLFIEDVG